MTKILLWTRPKKFAFFVIVKYQPICEYIIAYCMKKNLIESGGGGGGGGGELLNPIVFLLRDVCTNVSLTTQN